MSDDARRNMAASVVMQLASAMGFDDDFGDDFDDDFDE